MGLSKPGFPNSTTGQVGSLTDLEVDGTTIVVDETNDRVGIGTATPNAALTVEGAITLKERAADSGHTAAYGQLWVKNEDPCELYFTTDAGTDIQITDGTTAAFVGDITGVTAGVGLSGGGTSGAVTLALDLSELSAVTPADGDSFSTLDSDGAVEQRTTTTALATLLAGTGLTASSSVIGVDAAQTQITSVGTIGTGTWQGTAVANSYVAALPTSKITSGTMADARIAASNVTQHQGSITGTGAVNSGSITSGFTSIDVGAGAISTTGVVSTGDVSVGGGDILYANAQNATLSVAATSSGTDGRDLTIAAGSAPTGAANQSGGDLVLAAGGGDGTGTSVMTFNTKVSGTDGAAERMRIHTDGNVGIGTNAPSAALHVKGATPTVYFEDSDTNYTLSFEDGLTMGWGTVADSDSFMQLGPNAGTGRNHLDTAARDFHLFGTNTTVGFCFDESEGKFGFGTVAPGTLLQVEGSNAYVTLKNSTAENTSGGCETKLIFEDHGDNALGQIEVSHVGTSDDEKGQIVFSTNNDSGLQAALTITDTQAATFASTVTSTGFTIGSAAITEAELEIIDGATVTTTELNLLDGNTSVGGSITLADGDGFIVNDGGAMKTIPASDIKTYAGGSTPNDVSAIIAVQVFS